MLKSDEYLRYAQEKEDPEIKNPTVVQERGFKKGHCANPRGRPPGVKDWRQKLAEGLREHAPAIINKCVDMALDGDQRMIQLCIDKIIPNRRIELLDAPVLKKIDGTQGSVLAASEHINNALADNVISVDQAIKAQAVLEGHQRIINAINVEERVKKLEELFNQK